MQLNLTVTIWKKLNQRDFNVNDFEESSVHKKNKEIDKNTISIGKQDIENSQRTNDKLWRIYREQLMIVEKMSTTINILR